MKKSRLSNRQIIFQLRGKDPRSAAKVARPYVFSPHPKLKENAIQAIETAMQLSILSGSLLNSRHPVFNISLQKILVFLLFVALAAATINPMSSLESVCQDSDSSTSTCESAIEAPSTKLPTVNLLVKKDLSLQNEDCIHIQKIVSQILADLPSSRSMIQSVIAQTNFSLTCMPPSYFFSENPLERASAQFSYSKNTIIFPAILSMQTHTNVRDVHHEFIHADTSRRHKTPYCHVGLFTQKQTDRVNQWLLQQKLNLTDSTVAQAITISPVWPPTEKSVQKFVKHIHQDMHSTKIQKLRDLHIKKHRQEKMSLSEENTYKKYLEVFAESFKADQEAHVIFPKSDPSLQNLIKSSERIEKFVSDDGVVYYEPSIMQETDKQIYLQGKIADPISDLMLNIVGADYEYKSKMAANNRLIALSEMETQLRTGRSEKVMMKFFPRLWKHLQAEEDYCDKGLMKRGKSSPAP